MQGTCNVINCNGLSEYSRFFPETSWFRWCYEKMTINKVVQNHQVNKFGTTQNLRTMKTGDSTANF